MNTNLFRFAINSTLRAHGAEYIPHRQRREDDRRCRQKGTECYHSRKRTKDKWEGDKERVRKNEIEKWECLKAIKQTDARWESSQWVRLTSLTAVSQSCHITLLRPGIMSALHLFDGTLQTCRSQCYQMEHFCRESNNWNTKRLRQHNIVCMWIHVNSEYDLAIGIQTKQLIH